MITILHKDITNTIYRILVINLHHVNEHINLGYEINDKPIQFDKIHDIGIWHITWITH